MSFRASRLLGFPAAAHLARGVRREIEKTVCGRVTPAGGILAMLIALAACDPNGILERGWQWVFLAFGVTAWWAQIAVQVCVQVPLMALLYNRFYGARLRRAFREELKSRGLCVLCGYSLTGNVSGTCPECGTPVAAAAAGDAASAAPPGGGGRGPAA